LIGGCEMAVHLEEVLNAVAWLANQTRSDALREIILALAKALSDKGLTEDEIGQIAAQAVDYHRVK
jgi:alkylhydroperoxidase/carboxymuconolactone decarboxylase family protein YurZ